MEGGDWAEIVSKVLFTFLIGLAYNVKKGQIRLNNFGVLYMQDN